MGRLENLLGALSLTLADRVVAVDAGEDLSATDQAALVTLAAHPDVAVSWLGDVLGLTSSGATRMVDRLVAGGWVSRSTGEDSRQRRVTLTRAGTSTSRRLRQARLASLTETLAPLDAAERVQLEIVLERLVAGLASSYGDALTTCRLCDRSACRDEDQECPLAHTVPVGDQHE